MTRSNRAITLKCCGACCEVTLDEHAVRAGWLNEVRKNVECEGCGRVVILEFGLRGGEVVCVNQEIVSIGDPGLN